MLHILYFSLYKITLWLSSVSEWLNLTIQVKQYKIHSSNKRVTGPKVVINPLLLEDRSLFTFFFI